MSAVLDSTQGSKVTSGVEPHQPHLSPGGAEELQQLAAGPHQQLVSGVDGAAAVEQDAASVLHGQQVHLRLVPSKVNVPAREIVGSVSPQMIDEAQRPESDTSSSWSGSLWQRPGTQTGPFLC